MIILNTTVLGTTLPEKIELHSLTNPDYVYNVASWTNTSSQLSFSVTLNSGKYGFKLYDDVYGWYDATSALITVSKSATAYTVATTQTSFNGGVLTITGNNIG